MHLKGKYNGISPVNARVSINYKNKEDPVRFEYINPDKENKVIFSTLFMIWIEITLKIILFPIALIFLVYLIFSALPSSPFTLPVIKPAFSSESIRYLFYLLIILNYFLLPPLLAFLITKSNRKLLKYFPKLNYYLHRTEDDEFFADFTSSESKIIEIPLFHNVKMDYKAEGDFSKYLEKVHIIEHPFRFKRVKGGFFRKRRYSEELNDELWKSQFIFSEIPKKGRLRVWFM